MSERKPVVGVVAKPANPHAKKLTQKLIDYLVDRKISFLVDESTAQELKPAAVTTDTIIPRKSLAQICSPIVVLGGDGTLISVCRHAFEPAPIIIGVNLGTLGFLTEIAMEELFPTLEAVIAGSAVLERRFLLDTSVHRSGRKVAEYTAINDVVATKEALARIFAIELSIDGEFAALVRGDGLIVATPGGSTAYSLAAGGSIVHPLVDAVLVTPICPHSLTSRPLVLPGRSRLSLKVFSNAKGETVFLTVDGQDGMPLYSGDQVQVTTSTYSVLFAKSPSKHYYEILGTKLKWGTR